MGETESRGEGKDRRAYFFLFLQILSKNNNKKYHEIKIVDICMVGGDIIDIRQGRDKYLINNI